MYQYLEYVRLKLRNVLILVQISDKRSLFLGSDTEYQLFLVPNTSKFGIILLCLKGQLCAIAKVAQNSAC